MQYSARRERPGGDRSSELRVDPGRGRNGALSAGDRRRRVLQVATSRATESGDADGLRDGAQHDPGIRELPQGGAEPGAPEAGEFTDPQGGDRGRRQRVATVTAITR